MKAVRSVVLLVLASLPAATFPPLLAQTPYVEANDGTGTLQGWYNSSTALSNSPAGWWNSANSITLLRQNSWHGNVGGGITIKPGFVCRQNANGNLQVFGMGSNGSLHSIWQAPGWTTSWPSIGHPSGQPLNPYLIVSTMRTGGRLSWCLHGQSV